ncbi:MAG TPA: hypothetical protein VLD55_08445 [Candidatus Sulfobium mesophilum]|nr:hypothetical protein [Candidatus Sulfobium mesophilum]
MNIIKSEHGLDLVLATDLLSRHAALGPEQTAALDFHSGGNMDSFEFTVAAGKLAAIYFIGFA